MTGSSNDLDVVIVGAGFSGLYMLHRASRSGLTARVFERGSGVGGTWYWNRYPGARCDAESIYYSYSFSPELQEEWRWTERFATQPEILAYLDHVADRFGLREDIVLDTEVRSATYDSVHGRWLVGLADGSEVSARYCVMATGCLSEGRIPLIDGLTDFTGEVLRTGAWPHSPIDFTGRRVAVVGTGSSGIQVIPEIAQQAEHLTVLQRTPSFSVPAHNTEYCDAEFADVVRRYPEIRAASRQASHGGSSRRPTRAALAVSEAERFRAYEDEWDLGGPQIMGVFTDLMVDEAANETLATFIRSKIKEIVADPSVAAALLPQGYPVGSKRLCVDTDYFATYNRPNVDLVDLRTTPIRRIRPNGIETSAGVVEVDTIVFATGFDAMTGALLKIDIRGVGGLPLREKWQHGPTNYLGLAVSGFPNMFLITGPGSPSVLGNMVTAIEQHVEWVGDHLDFLAAHGYATTEASPEAEADWVEHVNTIGAMTLFPRASSWYSGANIPGKPQVFMPYAGGYHTYRDTCDDVAAKGYQGFTLRAAPQTRR